MTNGFEIVENINNTQFHELRIFVEGNLVYTKQAASLRWLSESANDIYKKEYNKHNTGGWTMA